MNTEVSNSIIGNNDGPTDIFVNTTNFLPTILTGTLIILIILGIIFYKKNKS
jgi:Na+-transporting methylmalonyl-CoA/oxaloacetate decarboxylase beta subunit